MSKAQQTKARIVQQAAAVFNQKGYAGSSIADIILALYLVSQRQKIQQS